MRKKHQGKSRPKPLKPAPLLCLSSYQIKVKQKQAKQNISRHYAKYDELENSSAKESGDKTRKIELLL